jgi:hypothetical protein
VDGWPGQWSLILPEVLVGLEFQNLIASSERTSVPVMHKHTQKPKRPSVSVSPMKQTRMSLCVLYISVFQWLGNQYFTFLLL